MTKIEPCLGEEHLRDAFLSHSLKERPEKLKRGTKECPRCTTIVHIRTKICECSHIFEFSYKKPPIPQKYKKWEQIEWTTLEAGSTIYLESEDYWLDSTDNKVHFGECGEYKVKRVQSDGLLLFGKNGFSFQSMVGLGYQEKTGITRERAKVYRKTPQPTEDSGANPKPSHGRRKRGRPPKKTRRSS